MDDTSTWLDDRALLRLTGDDVRGFLQGLLTQDLARVTPDTPQWAGLLTPQGKALFDFLLWADGDAILIDCDATVQESLVRRLSMYRLRRAISIEPIDAGVHWSLAPRARAVADPRLAALGYRWLAPVSGGSASAAWQAHRLAQGVTEGPAELGSDKTLWLECNAQELNGVSFTKGCYVGQENTARMHYRAKVNRRLVVAPLGEPGDRTRASYPALGKMVELRRVESLGDALVPDWLAAALAVEA
ncbi:YgfZ/GcvT domain-containing protein [Sphingomonas sp. HT-1]|uniref:CAF17-like 4Fe-4S cluster assembly/insertion protein YgfZ n=1 Tax=unclassified Sphingomonas TaxID=196159 RepID=UPI0004747866|nr:MULTISPECIES: folate-binding protein YgfZ [unclassified Sphingomonas]KTF69863.1 aminomethyltransferase [Sphingomonas sp. WG]